MDPNTYRRTRVYLDPKKGTRDFAAILKELPADAVIKAADSMQRVRLDRFASTDLSLAFKFEAGIDLATVSLAGSRDVDVIHTAQQSDGGFYIWNDTPLGAVIARLEAGPDRRIEFAPETKRAVDFSGDFTFALAETAYSNTYELKIVDAALAADNYRPLTPKPAPHLRIDDRPFTLGMARGHRGFVQYPVHFGIRQTNQEDIYERAEASRDGGVEWRDYEDDLDIGRLMIRSRGGDDEPGDPEEVRFHEYPFKFTHNDKNEGYVFRLDDLRTQDLDDPAGFAHRAGADLVRLYCAKEFHPGYADVDEGIELGDYPFAAADPASMQAPAPDPAFTFAPADNRISCWHFRKNDEHIVIRVAHPDTGILGYLAIGVPDDPLYSVAAFYESSTKFRAGALRAKPADRRRRFHEQRGADCRFALRLGDEYQDADDSRLPGDVWKYLLAGSRLIIERWAKHHRGAPYESLQRA